MHENSNSKNQPGCQLPCDLLPVWPQACPIASWGGLVLGLLADLWEFAGQMGIRPAVFPRLCGAAVFSVSFVAAAPTVGRGKAELLGVALACCGPGTAVLRDVPV